MSKKQLIKDNLLMFVGGNVANAMNYALNLMLIRVDKPLFNLYTAYTSLSLILLIPSLVSMRVFTVFGSPVLVNIRNFFERHKNKSLFLIIIVALLLIPANFFLTRATENGTVITSTLLIFLAILGFVANIFRGIRQHEENYKIAVLSINLEAMGRVIMGFLFGVILNMGITGILIGHIIGLSASLLLCFDRAHTSKSLPENTEIRLKNIFFNTLVMTAGLEIFSNFDIVYSNHRLQNNEQAQIEFNTLQFFRKIIFFGIFTVSSTILSMGGKGKQSKRFMFMFTLLVGMTIGLSSGVFFLIFKPLLLKILGQDIGLITNVQLIEFLGATTLMSTAYLLSNWLFSLRKNIYIYIPLISSFFQTILFVSIGKDLNTLLNSFYISSSVFFLLALSACLIEVIPKTKQGIMQA